MFAAQGDDLTLELLVLPEATLLLTAAVIDPMRGANRLIGRRAYRWRVTTPDGGPAITASGVPIPADGAFEPVSRHPLLVVASYNAPARLGPQRPDPGLRRRLAGAAAHRPAIGAVEGGVWTLAMAGLLEGRRATTHWEDLPTLAAAHPEIEVVAQRFVLDGPRFTAAGAASTLDLMIELVRLRQGLTTALALARLFDYVPPAALAPGAADGSGLRPIRTGGDPGRIRSEAGSRAGAVPSGPADASPNRDTRVKDAVEGSARKGDARVGDARLRDSRVQKTHLGDARPRDTGLGGARVGDARVATAIRLMESNLAEPLSMAAIARRAGVSPRHLQALFRTALGVAPKAHYLDLRLGHAMHLLRETRRSIAAIAAETGFADPSAFSGAYLRKLGERPSQTRRRGVD